MSGKLMLNVLVSQDLFEVNKKKIQFINRNLKLVD